jgi:hypothetical protein
MLFDIKGRRRRVVQITYVGLALLMGGGLVLSGIGSSASGGLLDALVGTSGGGGSSDAKKPFEKQIKDADARLRANPKDQAALATLVRAYFGLAGLQSQTQNGQVVGLKPEGKRDLQAADRAWARYLATDPSRIDAGLAATAIQIYDPQLGLGVPKDKQKLVRPAAELAAQQNTPDAYINLVRVATLAGDTRTADLAERKALSLAKTKDERSTIKERIALVKGSGSTGGSGSGSAGGSAPGTSGP